MAKLSRLAQTASGRLSTVLLVAFMTFTAGCNSSGDSPAAIVPPPAPPDPPADPIAGVATPSSVAVVTATNAE
jgi:hypothetical protein